jgi:hypothetical protein
MNAPLQQVIGIGVSVLAVTLSLLNLAFQVRQQTRALRSQNYAHALGRLAAVQARLSSDPRLANLLARGVREPAGLTVEERIQFTWTFYEIFGAFEFIYDQSRANALPSAVWSRWEGTLAWWISLPGVAAWWEARPTPFSSAFTALVDDHRLRPRVDVRASRRWSAFLASPYAAPIETGPDGR